MLRLFASAAFRRPRLRSGGGEIEALESRLLLTRGGTPDPTFRFSGEFFKADEAQSIVEVSDGGFVLAGSRTVPVSEGGVEEQFVVAKIDAQGAVDTSFGNKGQIVAAIPGGGRPVKVFEAPDGGLTVVGVSGTTASGSSSSAVAVLRLNPDGSRDAAYGVEGPGLRLFDFPGDIQTVVDAVSLADGSIAIVGEIGFAGVGSSSDPRPPAPIRTVFVLKLDAFGRLDEDFGGENFADASAQIPEAAGWSIYDVQLDFYRTDDGRRSGAVAIDATGDGSLVIAGQSQPRGRSPLNYLLKTNPAGQLDDGFGEQGIWWRSRYNNERVLITKMTVRSNGAIVTALADQPPGRPVDVVIEQVLPGGGIDQSFGTDGQTVFDFERVYRSDNPTYASEDVVEHIVESPEGLLYVVGSANGRWNDDPVPVVARLWPRGILDRRYGPRGVALPIGESSEHGYRTAVTAANGTFVLLGGSSDDGETSVVRLLPPAMSFQARQVRTFENALPGVPFVRVVVDDPLLELDRLEITGGAHADLFELDRAGNLTLAEGKTFESDIADFAPEVEITAYSNGPTGDLTQTYEFPILQVRPLKAEAVDVGAALPWEMSGDTTRVADIDGDGLEDVVSLSPNGTLYTRRFAGENGRSVVRGTSLRQDGVRVDPVAEMIVGDFGGDGLADVLLVGERGTLTLASGKTNGTFAAGFAGDWVNADTFVEYLVGDYDGDGADELAARTKFGAWWAGDFGAIVRPGGSGRVETVVSRRWPAEHTLAHIVGGDRAIYAFAKADGTVLRGDFANGFAPEAIADELPIGGQIAEHVHASDFTGDGEDDLFVVSRRGSVFLNFFDGSGYRERFLTNSEVIVTEAILGPNAVAQGRDGISLNLQLISTNGWVSRTRPGLEVGDLKWKGGDFATGSLTGFAGLHAIDVDQDGYGDTVAVSKVGRILFSPAETDQSWLGIDDSFKVRGRFSGPVAVSFGGDFDRALGDSIVAVTESGRWELARGVRNRA